MGPDSVRPVGPAPASAPARMVLRLTARRGIRSGALWGWVAGLYVASAALGYAGTFKTAAQRANLARLYGGPSGGVAALVGPGRDLESVPGYTEWKCLIVLSILVGVWGLLTATKSLRGEEDAGRWELLLSGATTRRGAAVQALGGLGAGLVALWVVATAVVVAVGRSSKVDIPVRSALFFSIALAASGAMFLAAGTLASQLAASRRQAAAYSGAVLGAAYAVRFVADSWPGGEWLRWISPLGWVESLHPLSGSDPVGLIPITVLTAGAAGLAVRQAGARDLGAATFGPRAPSSSVGKLLSGPTGLAVRLFRPAAAVWTVVIAVIALVIGLDAKQASRVITDSSFQHVLTRLGERGSGTVEYLSLSFLIEVILLAVVAAGQVSAARQEEAEGRADNLLVRPVSRWRWLGARLVLTALVVTGAGVTAGVAAWVGVGSGTGAGLGFSSLIGAGINLAPPAFCLLGLGALVMGVAPRAVPVVTYGVLAWSALVELVGGIVASNHWVLDTSLFHQMAPAPAHPPDVMSSLVMVAIGVVAAAVGLGAFSRRDLAGA